MIRKIALSVVPLVLVLTACGGDDDDAASGSASASASGSGSASASAAVASGAEECVVVDGSTEEATGELHVVLDEYAVNIEEPTVSAGVVKLEATNEGELSHEVVVLEAAPDDIEMGDDGAPVEVGFVGEIEAFAAGGECEGAFSLSPGTYTLLCAIVEESGESHFGEGMVTELTVE
jgi:hypothetical protein